MVDDSDSYISHKIPSGSKIKIEVSFSENDRKLFEEIDNTLIEISFHLERTMRALKDIRDGYRGD